MVHLSSLGGCFAQYNLIRNNSEGVLCHFKQRFFFVGFFGFFTLKLPYVNFKQNQNSRFFWAESVDEREERGALKEGSDPLDSS